MKTRYQYSISTVFDKSLHYVAWNLPVSPSSVETGFPVSVSWIVEVRNTMALDLHLSGAKIISLPRVTICPESAFILISPL